VNIAGHSRLSNPILPPLYTEAPAYSMGRPRYDTKSLPPVSAPGMASALSHPEINSSISFEKSAKACWRKSTYSPDSA
jgi:hypothetical protein